MYLEQLARRQSSLLLTPLDNWQEKYRLDRPSLAHLPAESRVKPGLPLLPGHVGQRMRFLNDSKKACASGCLPPSMAKRGMERRVEDGKK